MTGEMAIIWEVTLIVLLFIGVGGVLAVPAVADIRATVDDPTHPQRRVRRY